MINKWKLIKVENGKEFGEIHHPKNKPNEHLFYFCEDGHFNKGKRVRMYCTHKPGEGHKEWYANTQARNTKKKVNCGKRDRDTSTLATKPPHDEFNKKKLAL